MIDALRSADTPPPVQLFLELTSTCNLKCTHCYVRAGEGKRQQIPPSLVCRLIDEFVALGGQMVSVSGGEPTLYPEWRAVVRYARFNGLETMLLTNGARLTDEHIGMLSWLGCRVAVSLDGAIPATHDAFRGTGNFETVIAALDRLTAGGMGPQTTVMFTPMARNVRELPGVLAIADCRGIGTVYVSLLEDRGRAHDRLSSLVPEKDAVRALIYSILSLQDRYPNIAIQCLNLKMFTERLRGLELDAEGLDRTLRVTATGEVYLTAYLDDEPFHLGRYEPGNLSRVWNNGKVELALHAAERRRQRTATACRDCFAWEWCRGGSSAFAWNVTGSFDGEDGFCEAKRMIVSEAGVTARV